MGSGVITVASIETTDGRNMWLDYTTDPHNDIGWVVDDAPNSNDIPGSDDLTVAEAIELAPDKRDKIIADTRDVMRLQAEIIASDHHANYPPEHYVGVLEALSVLGRQLAEVTGE